MTIHVSSGRRFLQAGITAFVTAGALMAAQPTVAQEDAWLPSLITATPQAGFELAITLSRRAVKATQSDPAVLKEGRKQYATSAESLISVSQVVAINFQTIAAANGYWQKSAGEAAK